MSPSHPLPDTDLSEPAPDADTLTKAQLAELLYQQIGFNKRESKDLVDAFFDQISERLIQGDDVKLSGFGNFQVRTKAPRPGRNPRTGEAVAIAARRVVTFHASPKLKEAVQSGRVSDDDGSDA
ncbi:integration host factor subunit alpha [Serpentinimonas barnesii]|mgnify:CR=1 FL=1|uniref:integration host factor subunit alpha n=1 Tax=Serpentinimonas barnesii TaxID=1458427 RepID=UPI000497CC4C